MGRGRASSAGEGSRMDTIREMMDYVGFGAADGEALRALLPFADPVLTVIAERFYDAIDRSPPARGASS
jgi:hypothetical protein